MELGLYRKPVINFQGSKPKRTSQLMYSKVLLCNKNAGKFNFSDSFFKYVIQFSRQTCFLSTP